MTSGAGAGQHVAEYRFECPELPDVFHVTHFEAIEVLNQPYRATVNLLAEHEATDGQQLLGRDVVLSIGIWGSERSFRGIVDRVTVGHDALMRPTCIAVVVPALFALSRTLDTRIFQDRTALEIVETVLTESLTPYARTFRSEAVDRSRLVTRNYCVQYRETSLAFVHRLLEEEGIGYYFDQESEPETLVLFDDNRALARTASAVQFATPNEESVWNRMISFPGTSAGNATSFVTRDYDWRRGGRGQLEHQSAIAGADARRPHEVYEHGVGRHHVIHEDTSMLLGMLGTLVASAVNAELPMPLADLFYDLKGAVLDPFSSSNTEDRGRIRRQWHERDANVFEGISVVNGLSAGTAFELVGHPSLGGEYFVTRIAHSSAPPPSELIGNEAERIHHHRYHNRMHCLPRTTQWRPDTVTPKPRIEGVQTAIVTGPPGLDVYTDPYGRIKVRFPWDRADTDLSGHYTCWLRVSQTWAGATAPAFLFIPRVGMEVLVSFVDGDPDRPLVIGCVHNGDNPAPALLPPQATKSIIRTQSVPGGIGYNELSFEDAAGMERVHLRAQRDLTELVQNNHEVQIGCNEQLTIGGAQTQSVGSDHSLAVGRHYRRSIGADGMELTQGDHHRTVRGSARERIGHNYELEVEGSMSTHVQHGEVITYAGHAVTVMQGASNWLHMSAEDGQEQGQETKGLTLSGFGSIVHLTQDRIELRVGGSSLVVTPEHVQVNGKTLPLAPGDPPRSTTLPPNPKTTP